MAKKEPTEAIHVRLPAPVVKELDKAAEEEFESRSRMAAQLIRDGLKARQPKPKK